MLTLDDPVLRHEPPSQEEMFQIFYANARNTKNLSYIKALADLSVVMNWSTGFPEDDKERTPL